MFDVIDVQENETINFIESGKTVKIELNLPKEFVATKVQSIKEAYEKISSLEDQVKKVCFRAFVNKEKSSWNLIQFLLCY